MGKVSKVGDMGRVGKVSKKNGKIGDVGKVSKIIGKVGKVGNIGNVQRAERERLTHAHSQSAYYLNIRSQVLYAIPFSAVASYIYLHEKLSLQSSVCGVAQIALLSAGVSGTLCPPWGCLTGVWFVDG